MADLAEPVVYDPEEGETLKKYLERYSIDQLERIIQHPEKSIRFSEILKDISSCPTAQSRERAERVNKRLWNILPSIENYRAFFQHVSLWEETRNELLEKLAQCSSDLVFISKYCTYSRMIGCSVASLCTIGGLHFSESKYSNAALNIAAFVGNFGIAITVLGLKKSWDTYQELLKVIQRDQTLSAPIHEWKNQNEELEKAMNDEFLFTFTDIIVKAIDVAIKRHKKINLVNLLCGILSNLVVQRKEKIKDYRIIENIIDVIDSQKFKDFVDWIILQEENQIILNMLKMSLQYYYSDIRFIIFQSVRALAPANQNLTSAPVLGQLILNGFSLINDSWRLRRFEVPGVKEMQNAANHLRKELEVVKKIENALREINPDS